MFLRYELPALELPERIDRGQIQKNVFIVACQEKSVGMDFKTAASEPGIEGGVRTRTAAESVDAKNSRTRTQPYALETCLGAAAEGPGGCVSFSRSDGYGPS